MLLNTMFSLTKHDHVQDYEFDIAKIVYTKNESRPSKSLIDCQKYNEYIKIDKNLDISNEFSYLSNLNKPIEYYVLHEILIKMKKIFKINMDIDSSNKYTIFDSFNISFDSIIINEYDDNCYIFCIETKVYLNKILNNLCNILLELENGNHLVINFVDLFTSPAVECLLIFKKLFEKITIFYCKILSCNILICINYKQNSNMTILIKNLISRYNSNTTINIRQIGIKIETAIIKKVLKHNINVMDYYLYKHSKINQIDILEEKEYLFKNYCKRIGVSTNNSHNCYHTFQHCIFYDCFICKRCSELFCIY